MAKDKAKNKSAKKAKQQAAAPETASVGSKVQQFRDFFDQSLNEMKKVTWPTKKEVMVTSAAVMVLTVVMALFLGVVDLGLAKLIEAVLA